MDEHHVGIATAADVERLAGDERDHLYVDVSRTQKKHGLRMAT